MWLLLYVRHVDGDPTGLGVAALIKSMNPGLTNIQIKNIILNTVDVKPSLAGKVKTGGRLNATRALQVANATLWPPLANFTGTPLTGTAPLTVVFTDLSMNATAWNWTFGDGSGENTSIQNPVHTYVAPGSYTVSLNASNAGGSDIMTKVGYINITSPTGGMTEGVGVFRPSTHTFYLRSNGYPAIPATVINCGLNTDLPVTGDWNGDGTNEVGVFRPSTHTFYLRTSGYPATPASVINWDYTDLPQPETGTRWNSRGGVLRHRLYFLPQNQRVSCNTSQCDKLGINDLR
jgi:PKD repeat protein